MVKNDNENKFVIHGVGNYQLCFRDSKLIVPLNEIREDKIIKSKNKTFLVIRHATIEKDIVNAMFNLEENASLHINANHEMYNINNNEKYRTSSCFKNAIMKYVALENRCAEVSDFILVFELLSYIEMFNDGMEIVK